ncbi:Tim44/TimA family putative adaptor protein [Candidatus Pelagibacter communis]|jgi:predicted lipid-binding transport protein (Tim44 family)|uniref:Tim44/TimA family putative adaptor protein n=1 Tax=Pelagibacter ubique TaxID=198252 RepID=UPI00094D2D55|nr:Tim44/TimA family putative adaptor protein [Candidatus Pelagibacter ubique]|tara:strand:- start:204 stop:800 length:597 start_codon:yes stop_codon:yes gene_type:complete
MNYSFEYIDIILLAMIAGFIFLRLRGILGKRTGFQGKAPSQFEKVLNNIQTEQKILNKENFDDDAQKEFLKGAKIAYETIITDFSDNDNKLIASKPLLSKKIHDQFEEALKERSKRGHFAEITFIGVNSAKIKEHKKIDKFLNVTVDFVSEIITCIKDKDKNVVSGDPEKIKKIYDTWVFSRDMRSNNPNWQLVDTLT